MALVRASQDRYQQESLEKQRVEVVTQLVLRSVVIESSKRM